MRVSPRGKRIFDHSVQLRQSITLFCAVIKVPELLVHTTPILVLRIPPSQCRAKPVGCILLQPLGLILGLQVGDSIHQVYHVRMVIMRHLRFPDIPPRIRIRPLGSETIPNRRHIEGRLVLLSRVVKKLTPNEQAVHCLRIDTEALGMQQSLFRLLCMCAGLVQILPMRIELRVDCREERVFPDICRA